MVTMSVAVLLVGFVSVSQSQPALALNCWDPIFVQFNNGEQGEYCGPAKWISRGGEHVVRVHALGVGRIYFYYIPTSSIQYLREIKDNGSAGIGRSPLYDNE
jgi:hypothetical protein